MLLARPGDTLTMTNGVWSNASIAFAGYGLPNAPIVLRAETYGGVVIKGASNLRISGKHLVVDGLLFKNGYSPSGAVVEFQGTNGVSDSCRLTNSSIIDFNPADSLKDYKWISLYGTRNRVDHSYLRGKKHMGTTLVVWLSDKPNYHLIDHNYFASRPELYGLNGGETIRVGTSDWSMYDSFTTVEYNLFEECNGEIEIISNKSCENIYRYNTFVSCQGTLTLRHGNRCTVEGNFFFGNKSPNSGGIRIIGEDHKVFNNYIHGTAGNSMKSALTIMDGVDSSKLNEYFQVKRAVVAFNTFVDNRTTFNIGAKGTGCTLPPLDCVIANNVVYTTQSPIVTYSDTPLNMTWQGNIFYGASLGITQPSGIAISDPKLSLAADGLLRPGTTSPIIDGAIGSFPYITTDMDGQTRVPPYDAGADEVVTGPVSIKPLTPSDVGPPPQMINAVEREKRETHVPNSDIWLGNNYPNPFNPVTTLEFVVPRTGRAIITIYNTLGQIVAVIADGVVRGGERMTATFDASHVGSGVYVVQLQFEDRHVRRKMICLK
jgi:poly(beta-D-mannuronate) lyase